MIFQMQNIQSLANNSVSIKGFLVFLWFWALSFQSVYAKNFSKDEVVFVAFPAGNIKDDAFIIGKIKQVLKNGDYLLSVLDYVEGHDYGSSCVPMIKNEDPRATALGYDKGWEMWTDTTRLDTQKLDYVVPKENVMKLGAGKHYFVERNNLYIVFGRWKSDAPVLTVDRWNRAEREAKTVGLDELLPAFSIAKLHRQSYFADNNRPLYAFETIRPLSEMLQKAKEIMQGDKQLNQYWRAKRRDWQTISAHTQYYFLIEAIDKAVADAKYQLYEEGIENAGEEQLTRLKKLIAYFERDK